MDRLRIPGRRCCGISKPIASGNGYLLSRLVSKDHGIGENVDEVFDIRASVDRLTTERIPATPPALYLDTRRHAKVMLLPEPR